MIIDDTLYHIGASLKDLGKKCFAINKIEDKEYLNLRSNFSTSSFKKNYGGRR